MSKIPEDVMNAARAVMRRRPLLDLDIAIAILAERKRCAEVAKKARNDAEFYGNTDMMRAATLIAHRIEAGA